jgi:hypothetical protein
MQSEWRYPAPKNDTVDGGAYLLQAPEGFQSEGMPLG